MAEVERKATGGRWDLAVLVLFLAGLLVTASILSHHPAQVPDETYPASVNSSNLLGGPGAMLAENLFDALGVAVYAMLAAWFILVGSLFLQQRIGRLLRRMVGWGVLIVCAAIVADQVGNLVPVPLSAGSGGTIGAGAVRVLRQLFPLEGRVLVFSIILILGSYLALDSVLRWLARPVVAIVHGFGRLIRTIRLPSLHWARTPAASTSVLEEWPNSDVPGLQRTLDLHTVPISRTPRDLKLAENAAMPARYELPPISLLEDPEPFPHEQHDQHLRDTAALLEKTFTDFGLSIRVVGIHTGPVITMYEIALESGLRVSKVSGLADDLAIGLKVTSVRIVAPLPGKNTVGIEVPNEHRAVVKIKELLLASGGKAAKFKLPLFLGKNTEGNPLHYDLAEMPHLLIAGRTGTGKSVCLNAVILSLLLSRRPDECKMIMIDPKQVEFSDYSRIPHLMCPVVKDDTKAEAILAWAVDKMEERYAILSRARVRNIAAYNSLSQDEINRRVQPTDDERAIVPTSMPYIVIIIDEIGDLMMTMKKEVEGHIIRLAQKSRAAGIHLVLATQKPTVDVVTGLIKSNLPARICFQVSSRTDSRVVLDEMGADKLLGKGDMLFLQPGTSTLVRAQGAFASDAEIQRVVGHLDCDPNFVPELLELKPTGAGKNTMEGLRARDDLYEQAIEIVIREGRGSVSLLQRALGIGYGRAARLIDFMAEDGIVGHYNGSQARDVLYTLEQWQQMKERG
ncbi:MAG TPA: DNA translocase FtsK 4TM domain-containing protein [Gemmataceae bacterium]|jgi:S-DNA-T family DNA segregation ATPase FtsK/SpoIIIE|nr:DNA translocase FtsK 4TM domain-containing protein [Gemmataceae bacterium]